MSGHQDLNTLRLYDLDRENLEDNAINEPKLWWSGNGLSIFKQTSLVSVPLLSLPQYEIEQFNIRVKIIEPGPIKTDFYERSMDLTKKEGLTVYDSFIE